MLGADTVLAGRYELRSVVGSGGMPTVYLARERRLARDVAVKARSPTLAADPAQRDFVRAAAPWSPRMQAQYPPAQFIHDRFSQTQGLTLNGARLLERTGDRATVAFGLTEVIGNPPESRRWVGTRALVRTESGWLLDAPNLGPG